MNKKLADQLPLECTARCGALYIRIGSKVLAFAAENNPHLWNGEKDGPGFRITNPNAFARNVMYALNKEAEDGSTLLTRMLDQATLNAVESGSEGVEELP